MSRLLRDNPKRNCQGLGFAGFGVSGRASGVQIGSLGGFCSAVRIWRSWACGLMHLGFHGFGRV